MMAEKKSLTAAKKEAQSLSLRNPGQVYWVLDKSRRLAVCHGSEWCVRERILAGWHIVCKYRDGKCIKAL